MMTPAMSRRAQELAAEGTAFVTATVVHARRPTSVEPGNVALVLADGTIEGFVGGLCSEHSVRAYSLQALETGRAVLLRILPFADEAEVAGEEGTVTVQNPCLSGGAIEVFLEPVLPAARVLVVGDTPIADALLRLGGEVGFAAVRVDAAALEPQAGDLALVVAAHGRDELHTLRLGLEQDLPYVGLVASRKRGDGVLGELRGDGVPDALLERIDVPAGLDIGARTPAEIALSILARIVAVQRGGRAVAAVPRAQAEVAAPPAAAVAVDPICGMTVAAVATTPSLEHDGEMVYFCCDGCKARFLAEHDRAGSGD
ncbi:MAG: xanthine dehydrogenase accessory factor [Gaiellales bacterium]|nr:xanthine dehydrogenase accessory factor [Gaiellales bacterium]